MFTILHFSKKYCIFSLVPHSNSVRWVEAHSTHKSTEIQNTYVAARGRQSQESGQWTFHQGWKHFAE